MLSPQSNHKVNHQAINLFQQVTKRQRQASKWASKLPEIMVGDFLVIPLNSTKMLKSESYWMNNSSSDYAQQCSKGLYALFSIRTRSGERLATLGLENYCGSWRFDQCHGPSNSEVLEEHFEYLDDDGRYVEEFYPTEMYYAVHEVARLLNNFDGGRLEVFC